MDPLVFHTREIGSAQPENRIHETVAHPKKDPIGSIGVLIFFVQEEKTFGLGMKDLAPLSHLHAGVVVAEHTHHVTYVYSSIPCARPSVAVCKLVTLSPLTGNATAATATTTTTTTATTATTAATAVTAKGKTARWCRRRRRAKSHLRGPKDFPLEPHMTAMKPHPRRIIAVCFTCGAPRIPFPLGPGC